METATLNVKFNYNQIKNLIVQLPARQRRRLFNDLAQDTVYRELNGFIDKFRTNELSEDDILTEIENIRRNRYESKR